MAAFNPFWQEHLDLTRRYFLKVGAGGLATGLFTARGAWADPAGDAKVDKAKPAKDKDDDEDEGSVKLPRFKSYLTPDERFGDVSRGNPFPHSIPDEKKGEAGLTQDTWRLEVISDPDHPVKLRNPLTKAKGNAVDFKMLMALAEKHVVRFPKIMTCLNIGCPLGMGIWEGVPLRELIWQTQPREDVRRVFYYGYHNDDPKQIFQSSLPIGRVLEDLYDLPPVILCYKMNGQWLSAERGGPVRLVVPESYGFKSIKWLTHVVLTSLAYANDTYADQANDVDSPLKTFAATLRVNREPTAGTPIPVTGYAQVGIGGLSKVQIWIEPAGQEPPKDDPYFAKAPWIDMEILGPPDTWGGGLPNNEITSPTFGFDPATGRPRSWPMRLCAAHWAGVHPGLPAGKYLLRSRTIDEKGNGQPMPRPFRKSGHATIEQVSLVVR